MDDFQQRNDKFIVAMQEDIEFQRLSQEWYQRATEYEYSYHFSWMGLPIIQHPQDIIAMQEIIFQVKPDLIIETGVARGGSVVFYAAMMKLLGLPGKVIGIDIEIRKPNRIAIESHPMAEFITLIETSSTDAATVARVHDEAAKYERILVILDSNHTEEHVLAELRCYSSLVKPPGYLVVFDTQIEYTPESFSNNKPWGPGNNPMTAINKFLQENSRFKPDQKIVSKLQITECPSGYLKCIA